MRRAEARLKRVDHHQQLHQVLVDGRAGGLDDEDVLAADVLVDLHVHLAVREARDVGVAQAHVQVLGDLLGQGPVRVAREQLQLVRHGVLLSFPCPRKMMAGAGGIEPPLRGPKPRVLPLDDAPRSSACHIAQTSRRAQTSRMAGPGDGAHGPARPAARGSRAAGSAARGRASAPGRTPSARCPTSPRRARPRPSAPPSSARSPASPAPPAARA